MNVSKSSSANSFNTLGYKLYNLLDLKVFHSQFCHLMSAPATDEIECTSLALQDMNKFSYFKYRIQIFTEYIWLTLLCDWEELFIKYTCLFWMAKIIFVSYRTFIIARVISNNLNNSCHFLIQMRYGVFFIF